MAHIWAASTTSYTDSSGGSGDGDYISHSYISYNTSRKKEQIRCTHCGVKNKHNAPYCSACGAPLPDETKERYYESGQVKYTEYEEPEGLIAKILSRLSGR